MNHGSYETIRDKVNLKRDNFRSTLEFEKAWIKSYIERRHAWLKTHKKKILQGTIYRTAFFLEQISKNNWALNTPMRVHGTHLTSIIVNQAVAEMEKSSTTKPINIINEYSSTSIEDSEDEVTIDFDEESTSEVHSDIEFEPVENASLNIDDFKNGIKDVINDTLCAEDI